MAADISDFKRIEISDKYNDGFLDFAWDGPSQGLFVWSGSKSEALDVYKHIKDLMNGCGAACANFSKLEYCEAAWGNCAYIMLGGALSVRQKQEIAKGMELKGYTIAIKQFD